MKKFATLTALSFATLALLTWSFVLPVIGVLYLSGHLH